jgi:hypothetical protein
LKPRVCLLVVLIILFSAVCFSGCSSGKVDSNNTSEGVSSKANWTNTGGKVSNFSADALAYDSAHNVLYAGCKQQVERTGVTAGRGVWKYDGKSWTDTGGEISNYHIASLAYDSAHNLLYAGCYKLSPGEVSSQEPHGVGVWKYNGKTWTSTGRQVRSFEASALAYDSARNILYAAFQYTTNTDGVWKYDGKSWTNTGADNYSIVSLAYDGKHNLLYAGTRGDKGGVLKYTGTEWTNTGGGVSGFWVDCLAYDSVHNMLYAGTGAGVEDINHFGHSVWKYDGTNWTNTGGVVSSYSVDSLACDSAHNTIYANYYFNGNYPGQKGVWKYDGTTWTNISDEEVPNYRLRPLAYDSRNNLLYAGCMDEMVNGKGVWKYDAH